MHVWIMSPLQMRGVDDVTESPVQRQAGAVAKKRDQSKKKREKTDRGAKGGGADFDVS